MSLQMFLSQRFYPRDIPHLGALCRQIRLARGLTGTELARLCRCRSSATITRDFEANNQLGEEYFQRWLQVMQDGDRVPMPITSQQAALLAGHYHERDEATLVAKHRTLQGLTFDLIHPANPARSPALAELAEQLACTPYPAMIMDDLWFVHALNDALLRLYDIAPHGPFLHRWEAWHAVGVKIPADSPVRLAQEQSKQYIPPTMVYFYQHELIQRNLFTLQVRHLLHRLFAASTEHEYEMHKWADQLLAFALPFDMESAPRVVNVNGTSLMTLPTIRHTAAVTVNGGRQVHFALSEWETQGPVPLMRQATPQRVYFAADYDRAYNFHANCWPQVTEPLGRLLV